MNKNKIYYIIPVIFTLFFVSNAFALEGEIIADNDNYILSADNSSNRGSAPGLVLAVEPNVSYGNTSIILNFNTSAYVDFDSFNNVRLGLVIITSVDVESYDACVYNLTNSFVELESNWINRSNVIEWDNHGGDYSEDNGVCVNISNSLINERVYWNITDLFNVLVGANDQSEVNLLVKLLDGEVTSFVGVASRYHIMASFIEKLYVDYPNRTNLNVVFQEGLIVNVNGVIVANNSQTQFLDIDTVNILIDGGLKYYLWNDSTKHRHIDSFSKLMDQNYTLTIFSRGQPSTQNAANPMLLMVALVSTFILIYSSAVFGKKLFT